MEKANQTNTEYVEYLNNAYSEIYACSTFEELQAVARKYRGEYAIQLCINDRACVILDGPRPVRKTNPQFEAIFGRG